MSQVYRLFGSELSPYSVKVRSYLRYKSIAHEWLPRTPGNQAEFQKHAKLPLIPLLVNPEGVAQQDSTPIIEALEKRHPDPALQPEDQCLAFVSALLEEYADEWLNKPMFHYRWHYEADQISSSDRIAANLAIGKSDEERRTTAAAVRNRMTARLSFVGSSPITKPIIEDSLRSLLDIIEPQLAARPYLFGGRPALGDFGLWAQLYEMSTDPTAGALIRAGFPHTMAWIERMLSPQALGPFASLDQLRPGLELLLQRQVAVFFLPWSTANASALARGETTFSLDLDGRPFSQECQKYHARSLAAIRDKFAAAADAPGLQPMLRASGCLAWLS